MTSTTVLQPPRTIREVWESLPEGTRAQVIENQLKMCPRPLDIHQKTLINIVFPLYDHVHENSLGEVRIAPTATYLDDENIFMPDMIFLCLI